MTVSRKETDPEFEPVFLAYCWETQRGGHRYVIVERKEGYERDFFIKELKYMSFAVALFSKKHIGWVFNAEYRKDSWTVNRNPKSLPVWYLGDIASEPLITEWKAQDSACKVAKIETKLAKSNYEKALDPFREAYWRATWVEQAAILAQVIKYITRVG